MFKREPNTIPLSNFFLFFYAFLLNSFTVTHIYIFWIVLQVNVWMFIHFYYSYTVRPCMYPSCSTHRWNWVRNKCYSRMIDQIFFTYVFLTSVAHRNVSTYNRILKAQQRSVCFRVDHLAPKDCNDRFLEWKFSVSSFTRSSRLSGQECSQQVCCERLTSVFQGLLKQNSMFLYLINCHVRLDLSISVVLVNGSDFAILRELYRF